MKRPKPVSYRLSNQQRKKLLIRGTAIRIALPVPPYDYGDPLEWARSVLPEDVVPLAREASEQELYVSAIRSPGDTLTQHLGHIIHEMLETSPVLVQVVIAIVVDLVPVSVRGRDQKIQWPHKVLFLGQLLPYSEDQESDD